MCRPSFPAAPTMQTFVESTPHIEARSANSQASRTNRLLGISLRAAKVLLPLLDFSDVSLIVLMQERGHIA